MLPENSDAAHGSSIPSHCARLSPSVGSQSPRVCAQLTPSCSRSRAVVKQVAKADVPAVFHDANNGHDRSGSTGDTKRGAAVLAAAIVIDAGKLCALEAEDDGGNSPSNWRSAV